MTTNNLDRAASSIRWVVFHDKAEQIFCQNDKGWNGKGFPTAIELLPFENGQKLDETLHGPKHHRSWQSVLNFCTSNNQLSSIGVEVCHIEKVVALFIGTLKNEGHLNCWFDLLVIGYYYYWVEWLSILQEQIVHFIHQVCRTCVSRWTFLLDLVSCAFRGRRCSRINAERPSSNPHIALSFVLGPRISD